MSHSIIGDVMAAANPNFRMHSLDEVRAAVNNAVALAGSGKQAVAGQREQTVASAQEQMPRDSHPETSLAGSVASMDAAEKPVKAIVQETVREAACVSREAEMPEPDIGM